MARKSLSEQVMELSSYMPCTSLCCYSFTYGTTNLSDISATPSNIIYLSSIITSPKKTRLSFAFCNEKNEVFLVYIVCLSVFILVKFSILIPWPACQSANLWMIRILHVYYNFSINPFPPVLFYGNVVIFEVDLRWLVSFLETHQWWLTVPRS